MAADARPIVPVTLLPGSARQLTCQQMTAAARDDREERSGAYSVRNSGAAEEADAGLLAGE